MTADLPRLTTLAWEAALPIRCTISQEHVATPQWDPSVHPVSFFLAPRMGYLFYSIAVPLRHFECVARGYAQLIYYRAPPLTGEDKAPVGPAGLAAGSTMASSAGVQPGGGGPAPIPVPWWYPTGVVIDRLAASEGVSTQVFLDRNPRAIPVTLRFSDEPVDGEGGLRLPVAGMALAGRRLVAQLTKGALLMMFGSLQSFLALPPATVDALASSVEENNPRAFAAAHDAVVCRFGRSTSGVFSSSRDMGESAAGPLLALMLHAAGTAVPLQVDCEDCPTLGHALRKHVPQCEELPDEMCQATSPLPPALGRLSLYGAEPSLATPTVFLRDHLCAPDMAVHVVFAPALGIAP